MATTCQSCSAVSQLWLCGRCQGDLRQMLDGLALGTPLGNGKRSRPWLQCLEDAALGGTRLGESARRSSDRSAPLPYSEPGSALLREVENTLGTWVRHLVETHRAVSVQPSRDTIAIALAKWLTRHIAVIALDQGAGELFGDIKALDVRIERVVNRPVPPKCCGPCPAKVADKHGQEQDCATSLYAPWDHHGKRYATDVECWKCHNTHNVDTLIQQALDSVAGLLYSAKEVHALMAQIGRPIPSRTWRYWRAEDKIIIRGWRGAEPMYWINDVQELLDQKTQKATTGAAAKKAV